MDGATPSPYSPRCDYACLLLADCTAEPVADMSHEASLRILQHQFGWAAQSAQLIAALEGQHAPSAA